jgi:Helix-turn-helix domain
VPLSLSAGPHILWVGAPVHIALPIFSVQLICSWCFCTYSHKWLDVLDAIKFFAALGRRVRSLRQARGYTQEDMISFGFSARHWQQIEKGRPITMKTLLRIALALKVPLCRLVYGLPRPTITED